MKQVSRAMIVVSILLIAALQLSACSDSSTDARADEAPATVEPIKGTDLSSVTLSEQASKRLDIKTGTVSRRGSNTVIPYDAVIYDASGKTFAYTNPKPLVFVRHSVSVIRIEGKKAILSAGPRAGTAVVTVGSQELYGSEYEVEED